jgi:hypothetical protein
LKFIEIGIEVFFPWKKESLKIWRRKFNSFIRLDFPEIFLIQILYSCLSH